MSSNACKRKPKTVKEIMNDMDYGPAIESDAAVKEWLEKHEKKFGLFINGTWKSSEKRTLFDTKNVFTGETLATAVEAKKTDADEAVQAARFAHVNWNDIKGRSRYLYSIARHIQKHQQIFTALESINTGRAVHEIKTVDIPQTIKCFYYYAGWAEMQDQQFKQWKSIGIVSAILPWNFPLLYLASVVAPAIAVGNSVIVKPSSSAPLTTFLFADICIEAGLPSGVFTVLTGPGHVIGKYLSMHLDVNKVAFIGSVEAGRELRCTSAGMDKKFSAQLGGKSCMIVFDGADLDAVTEGLVEGLLFNEGQAGSAASRLLIQDPIYETLLQKLKTRLSNLIIGNGSDKCIDLGSLISDAQVQKVKSYVEEAIKEKATIYQSDVKLPPKGHYYPPTLITDVNPGSKIVLEEVFGPVAVIMRFRTAKEAIAMANNTAYGLAASVWTKDSALSLEVAKYLKVSTVWINCHNVFDVSTGIGGCRLSGFGFPGGREALYSYMHPAWYEVSLLHVLEDTSKYSVAPPANVPTESAISLEREELGLLDTPKVDQTYKIYIGGAQKRPDSNSSRPIRRCMTQVVGHVGECSRKDVRDAVEAAQKAQPSWSKRPGYQRSQILFYIAENLQKRSDEFARYLALNTGCSMEKGRHEVEASIRRLFYWGGHCDKRSGSIQETNTYGTTLQVHEPVGVIGIACSYYSPLLSFVSLMAVAICRGNAVIIAANEEHPLVVVNFYQILDTSDVPPGVVNILTGDTEHLARELAAHNDVDAVWYFGSATGSKMVETMSIGNMKRVWVNFGKDRDWNDAVQGQGEEFLYQSTHYKNIWIPIGEIFAN